MIESQTKGVCYRKNNLCIYQWKKVQSMLQLTKHSKGPAEFKINAKKLNTLKSNYFLHYTLTSFKSLETMLCIMAHVEAEVNASVSSEVTWSTGVCVFKCTCLTLFYLVHRKMAKSMVSVMITPVAYKRALSVCSSPSMSKLRCMTRIIELPRWMPGGALSQINR